MKATLDEVMDAQDNLPEMAAILAPGVRVRGLCKCRAKYLFS